MERDARHARPFWISVVAAIAYGASTLELSPFGRHGRPFVSIRKSRLGSGDGFPLWREFCIQCDEVLLVGGYILFGKDGVDRALWHTDRAVNALARIKPLPSFMHVLVTDR